MQAIIRMEKEKETDLAEGDNKMKCWDYNDCGHGKDSLCPAVEQKAGRSCWLVAKTLCGGKVHGMHTQRSKACGGCGFYIYSHLSKPTAGRPILREKRPVKASRSKLPH